ncbi:MAG: helix-turn-helix domain-containing protein [Bacteroidota bacterium]
MGTFGQFVREKRLSVNLSLREFCTHAGVDPSNWSKIERGRLTPPDSSEKMEFIAQLLGFERNSSDWNKFFELSAMERGRIPDEVYSDSEVIAALPVLFRTAKGEKPTEEELNKIIDLLKRR